MDANGLRFWNFSAPTHWAQSSLTSLSFDDERRVMHLSSERALPPPADSLTAFAEASSRLERVPAARDIFGTFAYWDSATHAIRAAGGGPGTAVIFTPNAGEQPTDLAVGYDGVLYIAIAGGVTLVDLRHRFSARRATHAGFNPWRLAAHPEGGVWALDRTNTRLARLTGSPLPDRPYAEYAPETVRPCPEEPTPPRLDVLDVAWPSNEGPRAIAVSPAGRLAILSWVPDADASLRLLSTSGELGAPIGLAAARFPYSLAWIDDQHVAVMLAHEGLKEAPIFRVTQGAARLQAVGDIYPLRDHDGGPFLHGVTTPPHYPRPAVTALVEETIEENEDTPTVDGSPFHPQPLHRLSLPVYAREGGIANAAVNGGVQDTGLIADSENTQTEWHRIYVEAAIPAHCAFSIDLAASDELSPPAEATAWHEHRFGDNTAPQTFATANSVPRAAWVNMPSELPFHPGLLPCAPERDRSGLFTVLIQRAGLRVRTLKGRYLWVRVRLSGDGRATPEIAAIRCYGSRFSYLNQYLPELYREIEFGSEADDRSPATPADFLERFLDNFESVLTPLEDRIAASYLLTTPQAAPDDALPWLGSWIGMSFDAGVSISQRRRMLAGSPASSLRSIS
jgi:phage tail-like protein